MLQILGKLAGAHARGIHRSPAAVHALGIHRHTTGRDCGLPHSMLARLQGYKALSQASRMLRQV